MEKFRRCFWGYVLVSIQGEQLERFLNLCRSRGIRIHMLCRSGEEEIRAILLAKDVLKLRPVRRKTKVHIRILEKHGFPFFYHKGKKRKAFFCGILLCGALIFVLSTRVWNIHIEGNIINTTPQILEFLKEEGVTHGMAKSSVNCYGIADAIRRTYPEITWVSAKLEGTRLILRIQEGNLTETIQEEEKAPCDLTADIEGTIVKMVTRAGIPLVKTGDTCSVGDLLVLGRLDILNDSQEVVRCEYVHADADIYVEHSLAYYDEFPLQYEKETYAEKEAFGFSIRIGSWYFSTSGKAKKDWKSAAEEFPLRLTENFYLPVCFGKIVSRKYVSQDAVYTQEEAKAIAVEKLQIYEEKLIEKGLQISENNVKIEVNGTACISRGTLTVIEETGTETDTAQQEQSQERTA